jgi:hypothetical protein
MELLKLYSPDVAIDRTLQYNLKQCYNQLIIFDDLDANRLIPVARWTFPD